MRLASASQETQRNVGPIIEIRGIGNKALAGIFNEADIRGRRNDRVAQGWTDAYSLRGTGSTFKRRIRIEGIYERYVPVPDSRGDREVQQFLDDVKEVVLSAINEVENEVIAGGHGSHEPHTRESLEEILARKRRVAQT